MIHKVKAAVHGKVEAMSIDSNNSCLKAFFTSDWLWKYMWLSIHHHDVNKILLDRMKVREERLRRVDTISNEKKIQPWEEDKDFKDAQSKWRAESSVLD